MGQSDLGQSEQVAHRSLDRDGIILDIGSSEIPTWGGRGDRPNG